MSPANQPPPRPAPHLAIAPAAALKAALGLAVTLALSSPSIAQPPPDPYLIGPHSVLVSPPGAAITGALDLTAAVHSAAGWTGGVTLMLLPGDYHLTSSDHIDPTCGNCEDPAQPIPATLGLRVSGQNITLRGGGPDLVRIHTHAGYGLLFEDCADCRIEGVTVTGGERDTSGRATDAAIVVRRSVLAIDNCRVCDNIGDSATVAQTVVGIMGICGREGAQITVTHCEILRNSWDGIALYRDAYARIEDCVVDGVDRGAAGRVCGGRGVAIGITWNARADVCGNRVARYWKGIGVFVDAEAHVTENVVEDMLTWGIALWDADRGHPYAEIAWNAVHRTGACGISITRALEGGRAGSRIAHNGLVRTGQNPKYDSGEVYCMQRALAVHAAQPDVMIADNPCFENREPGDAAGSSDLAEVEFRAAVAELLARLAMHRATRESEFVGSFGAE